METDGGEMAPLRQIGGRPGLVCASSRRGEIAQSRIEDFATSRPPLKPHFRPPAPTRRTPRRIAKRRTTRPLVETRAAFSCDTPPRQGGRSALPPWNDSADSNFTPADRQPQSGVPMNVVDEYRAKAWECLSLAESMNDPARRADVLRYARLW